MIIVRGGGDLASGVALRLFRSGMRVVISELAQPSAVRRTVSFANAVYDEEITIEGVTARLAGNFTEINRILKEGTIPILVDPDMELASRIKPEAIVDGRMLKGGQDYQLEEGSPFVIGLGPGFEAGKNCHAVVETKRGHYLGRVYWSGSAETDTRIPESVGDYQVERVLRAPDSGPLMANKMIGDLVQKNEIIAWVNGKPILAQFNGILRGIVHNGLVVQNNMKVGDLDPRNDTKLCFLVSDKALAVGGGVLEALLSIRQLRSRISR